MYSINSVRFFDLKSLRTCQSTKEHAGSELRSEHAGSEFRSDTLVLNGQANTLVRNLGANSLVLTKICAYNPIS